MVHCQRWPCAKPTELKTFVQQDFHGIHLGTFLGLSNPHISKITNFNFSQNSLPSQLAMLWRTDQLGPVQNPPNSKISCTKTFMVLIWEICRPFQPSHLKNHEFEFFTKLPTKPSSYVWCSDQLGPVQNPPNSKISCTKTFMVFIWGHL